MRKSLMTFVLLFIFSFSGFTNIIKGLVINQITNEAISGIVIESPFNSSFTVSEQNGSFELRVPKNISTTEEIYLYVKSNKWKMIKPTEGDFIILKQFEVNKALIIEMIPSTEWSSKNEVNNDIPIDYNDQTDKGAKIIQIQVGANKNGDFKNELDIEKERKRLERITGYKIKHVHVKYSPNPHKFLIAKTFNDEVAALKVQRELKNGKNNINALFFKED